MSVVEFEPRDHLLPFGEAVTVLVLQKGQSMLTKSPDFKFI